MEWFQLTGQGVWAHTALAEAHDVLVLPELKLTLTKLYDEVGIVPMQAGFAAGEE